ncbi:MAG: hypothetical protein R3C59_02210 [Planctomycetaceae bacterium]
MNTLQTYQNLFRHQHWEIGVVSHPIQAFLDPDFEPVVNWMPGRPAKLFRADPFLMPVGERRVILYEDFDYTSHVGRISAAEFDGERFHELAIDALPADCHLAYPFTIRHNDEWFCIPETHQHNEIAAWKLDPQSFRLRKVATLISGFPAVDSTVFQHNGLWWLACTRQDAQPLEKLHLWYADDLFGSWQPHRRNPVKSDTSSSRPAGTPFTHDGQLYRPAQDCSKRYGGAVVINRIVTLSPDTFEEENVRIVRPIREGPYSRGIHTLASFGDLTVVDGLRYAFIPGETWRVLKRGCCKLFRRSSRNHHKHPDERDDIG